MMSTSTFSTLGVRRIREANLSRTLNLIHQVGRISRAGIVRETGLSATTVSLLVNVLLESGFVHESGVGQSSGGRPPILVQFNYSFRYLLGVDMGATHLTVILMDLAGHVVARRHRSFDVAGDPQGAIKTIVDLVGKTLAHAEQPLENILGIGVAVAAPLEGERLDRPSGVILPKWEGVELVASLQPALKLPIRVENDANAGAIAEKWWGKGTEYDNLAYIKLGTGVGGGLIAAGTIYRGSGGTAGEIGHTPIDLNGPLCRCGKRGCLESYVGARAIIARVAQLREEAGEATNELTTIQSIIDAAHDGNARALGVLEQAGRHVGIGVANLLNLFNPALIVIGGDLEAAGDFFLEAVRSSVRERAIPKAAQEAQISFSGVGADAIAIGAATVMLQHAFEPANLSEILPV